MYPWLISSRWQILITRKIPLGWNIRNNVRVLVDSWDYWWLWGSILFRWQPQIFFLMPQTEQSLSPETIRRDDQWAHPVQITLRDVYKHRSCIHRQIDFSTGFSILKMIFLLPHIFQQSLSVNPLQNWSTDSRVDKIRIEAFLTGEHYDRKYGPGGTRPELLLD